MAEFLLELLSEEIPAGMQEGAGKTLVRLFTERFKVLNPREIRIFYTPRRLALAAVLDTVKPASGEIIRGPKTEAPENALAGFLKKNNARQEELREENGYWLLEKNEPESPASAVLAALLPGLIRDFSWPKSMRWGTSSLLWVRPLRRILCLLDGETVPFSLQTAEDSGNHLQSGNKTEGHRFLAPEVFAVSSVTDWLENLEARFIIADQEKRRKLISHDLKKAVARRGLSLVPDEKLLDEVTGLVEWPVVLIGSIDQKFMTLPAEVMQVSMRINQRYFALRTPDDRPAPAFAFVANIAAKDHGKAIIAGNERVLRARFADAGHFFDHDRQIKQIDRVPALNRIVFHAKLGTEGERVRRIQALTQEIAPLFAPYLPEEELTRCKTLALRAALLCKADLTTGMVGEFPELQGVIGSYYALFDGEKTETAMAVAEHYSPKGPTDAVPKATVSIIVALADKLDMLAGFFSIGEIPTGSGDPYALRRAALGILRILRENNLNFDLRQLIAAAVKSYESARIAKNPEEIRQALEAFLIERLRVQLKAEGHAHDVLAAVFDSRFESLTVADMIRRLSAIEEFLAGENGKNLLIAYRRGANILRIEEKKDGVYGHKVDGRLLHDPAETELSKVLSNLEGYLTIDLRASDFKAAVEHLAKARGAVDLFFERVTVNAPESGLRKNRLSLLSKLRFCMHMVADFSKLEG